MHDKPVTTAVYLLVGLFLAFGPIAAELLPAVFARRAPAPAGAAPKVRSRMWGFGCAWGVLLGLTLLWGRSLAHMSLLTVAEAVASAAAMTICLRFLAREARAPDGTGATIVQRRTFLAIAGVFAVACAFNTGMMRVGYLSSGWQNWGAYIAPAEIMRDGGRIFYDFPAQYGLGPTTLLAAGCSWNCWGSMYGLVAVVTVGFAAALVLPLFALRFRTAGGLAVAAMAVAAAALLWISNPNFLATANVFPSVGGLRFLPAAALTAVLWWSESSPTASARWIGFGFALFVLGVLWSPESLFMCLAVWGPYYCLRRMAGAAEGRRFGALFWSLVQIALSLLLAVSGFVVVYEMLFGILPKLHLYLVYMLFPPGPLPINWLGPVWFCIFGLVLGAWTCWRLYRSEGNTPAFRRSVLLLMMAYASMAYAMGRSHDNNFVNLLPYFALLLASVFSSRQGPAATGTAAGMIASLVGLLFLFNWSVWSEAPVEFDGRHLVDAISFRNPQSQKTLAASDGQLHADRLSAALDRVQEMSADPVDVIDQDYLNMPGQRVWSALHGAANYAFMPDDYRTLFVVHGALRFHKKGWLVIDSTMMSPWVPDLLAAYRIEQDIDFGTYHALHLAPRPDIRTP